MIYNNVFRIIAIIFALYVASMISLIVKRKLLSPEKSWLACILNVALTPLRLLKVWNFKGGEKMVRDVKSTLVYATKKTGLTDFGDNTFVDNYTKLINTESHKREQFTNLGFIAAKIELGMGWVRRLKLIQYLKDVPDVKSIPIRSPVFVTGLPRTGTTFLHRLLSLDPAVRAPLTWELLAPVPAPCASASLEEHEQDRQKRAKYIRKLIKSRETLGDGALKHIHEIGWDLPEECLLALSDEIPLHLSMMQSVYMNMDLFLSMDAVKAYSHYKSILQLLSYQIGERTDPRRWTLKCPVHLYYLREIAKVFPDAKFIWTHRHPISSVPSLCSLVEAFHKVYYEPGGMDPNFGSKMKAHLSEMLEKTPKDISESGLDHMNILYADLVKDPISVVKKIYDHYGWKFSKEFEDNLQSYLAQNKQSREKLTSGDTEVVHSYAPEQFGINRKELTEGKFGEYCTKFAVPMDKN